MNLPTNEEIDRAYGEWAEFPPQPMAACVDRHHFLNSTIVLFSQSLKHGSDPMDIVKAAMVTGLNLGIRIGENRSK